MASILHHIWKHKLGEYNEVIITHIINTMFINSIF